MKWYLKVLKQYADFSGRARRKEYWMFVLFNMIVILGGLIALSIVGTIIAIALSQSVASQSLVLCLGTIFYLYLLAVLIPSLAVVVRRLHDVGQSGWMILVNLIPIVGGIWLFIQMLTEGDTGENSYGPDPKEILKDIPYKSDTATKQTLRSATEVSVVQKAATEKPTDQSLQADIVKNQSAFIGTEKPQQKLNIVTNYKTRRFPLFTGSGVCDVCNSPLGDVTAYLVPNDVFYSSQKWRTWYKSGDTFAVYRRLSGHTITDADIDQMQSRDQSQGSAVCKNCIHMF
jgi:uncharacterized membrane protein YhaH (DUF805 family)